MVSGVFSLSAALARQAVYGTARLGMYRSVSDTMMKDDRAAGLSAVVSCYLSASFSGFLMQVDSLTAFPSGKKL